MPFILANTIGAANALRGTEVEAPATDGAILIETGDQLLMETGDALLLE